MHSDLACSCAMQQHLLCSPALQTWFVQVSQLTEEDEDEVSANNSLLLNELLLSNK